MGVSLDVWWSWYNSIVKRFGYKRSMDQLATDILSNLIVDRATDLQALRARIYGRPVLVIGAGPSVEDDLQLILNENLLGKLSVLIANGATEAFLKLAEVAPEVVVSDLDGNIDALLNADERGAIMVIHGHGDNIGLLKKYVRRFRNVIGTTQVEPRPCVYNFGGFTDGDRAVFLAVAMGARLIVLVGMDLGRVVGKYSKRYVKSFDAKILKLQTCKELLAWLSSKVNIPLYNMTSHGENIKGFVRVTCHEIAEVLKLA